MLEDFELLTVCEQLACLNKGFSSLHETPSLRGQALSLSSSFTHNYHHTSGSRST